MKGETRVQDLDSFTLRLKRDDKERLLALAEITGTPAYQILGASFAEHFDALPETVKRKVRALVKKWQGAELMTDADMPDFYRKLSRGK